MTDDDFLWHAASPEVALDRLGASPGGLTNEEARRRLEANGPNQAAPARRESLLGAYLESLREPLQLLLIAVGVLSAIWGEVRDAAVIFGLIALVAGIEASTELRARRSIEGLRSLTAARAHVFRDAKITELPARELVVGDVVSLEPGDLVPADCRVLGASGILVDESALTGEAVTSAKGEDRVATDAPLAERSSMLYSGTAVVDGEARAVVVATAADTELGRLGLLVGSEGPPTTPLQATMRELARGVLVAAIGASVVVPLVGVARGLPLRQMLLVGLTLAFATIPEELPILVTVLLAAGGRRLARRGALLRRLRAAETLGAVTVVVTDKTGTLTQNRLRLEHVVGRPAAVLETALGCQGDGSDGGASSREPMEVALGEAAQKAGVRWKGSLIASYPFDPVRRRMSRVWETASDVRVCVKGAPESVLDVCAVSAGERKRISELVEALADEGLRVIALADKAVSWTPRSVEDAERDLRYVGLAAFEDPLREGVPESVRALRDAGVRTIVVTGDHPRTAAAIARAAGIEQEGGVLLGGAPLAGLDDTTLVSRLAQAAAVARATPGDKLRIVRLLQSRGEIVAVTGDGVNDAPALAAADVGIAMGKRGTDLARDAADVVLTDDAFPTIAAAVEGGRAIASQLRRAVAFYLGAKLALVGAMIIPVALGLPAPFAPVHIVLLEVFMDLGASVAFVSEPPAPGAMQRPPRDPARRFLDVEELGAILAVGSCLLAAVLVAFLGTRHVVGVAFGPAAAIGAWLIGHTLVAWTLRARPGLPVRDNPAFAVWTAAAVASAVTLAGTGAGRAFGLQPLTNGAWLLVITGACGGALVAAMVRRRAHLAERL